MTKRRRIVQIMPTDGGWWSLFAKDDGKWDRARVIGFALVDEWQEDAGRKGRNQPPEADVYRVVYPLLNQGTYIDIETSDGSVRFIGLAYESEWPTDDELRRRVQDHLVKEAFEEARRLMRSGPSEPMSKFGPF